MEEQREQEEVEEKNHRERGERERKGDGKKRFKGFEREGEKEEIGKR